MSATNPPDPNVNTFNNLYWITGDTALTQEVADKRYLRFPSAQGTENLQAINVNGVATFNANIEVGSATATNLTPVVDFNKSLIQVGSSGNGKMEVECELNVGGFGEINMEGSQLLLQANAFINQGTTNTTANNLGLTNFASTTDFDGLATFNADIRLTDGANTTDISQNGSNLVITNNVNSGDIFIQAKDAGGTTKQPVEISSDSVNITGTGLGNIALSATNTSQQKQIYFTPANAQGAYNSSALDNETTILAKGSAKDNSTLVLSTWSDTYNAVKVSSSAISLGVGGLTTTPTNNVLVQSTGTSTTAPITIDLPVAANNGLSLIDAGIAQSGSVVNGLQTITMNANQSLQLGDAGSIIINDYSINAGDSFIIESNPVSKIFTMRSNTSSITPTDVITFAGQTNTLDFPVPNPPTCAASSAISLSDDSNKLPSTAWVRDYVASVPSTIPADLTPNSISILPNTSPPTLSAGVRNYYNEGALIAVDAFVPYNASGSKQVRQYFARLVFNPSRNLGGGGNTTIYQSSQVRVVLTLTANTNVAYWGSTYGISTWYYDATFMLNYNYQQNYGINMNTDSNSSQGFSIVLSNSGSNNSGGWNGINPKIWVEKVAGQNWYNFYWLNGPFSAGGTSGSIAQFGASFTIELLNGGQSVDNTSSVWLEEYVVAVNV